MQMDLFRLKNLVLWAPITKENPTTVLFSSTKFISVKARSY